MYVVDVAAASQGEVCMLFTLLVVNDSVAHLLIDLVDDYQKSKSHTYLVLLVLLSSVVNVMDARQSDLHLLVHHMGGHGSESDLIIDLTVGHEGEGHLLA